MDLNITGRHCTIHDAVRSHVSERMETLSRLEPKLDSASVCFEIDHGITRAETRAAVAGAQVIIAHGDGESFNAAFDRSFDRLERQLKRRIDQRRAHHGARGPELAAGA